MTDEPITDKIWMKGDPSLTWFEYARVSRENGQEPTQDTFIALRDGYWMEARVAEMIRKMWEQ